MHINAPLGVLPKEEVIKAVERKNPVRIPLIRAKWLTQEFRDHYGDLAKELDRFSDDAMDPPRFRLLEYKEMNLPWKISDSKAFDAAIVLDDWTKLDDFIAKFPVPEKDDRIDRIIPWAKEAHRKNQYLMHTQWSLFYERAWQIRGMENLLTDYYLHPKEVHRLNRALCDLYVDYIRVVGEKLQPDGFWSSDDLGHQTQLMMPPEVFREFIKPYYFEIGKAIKKQNMHWWMHSCGNNTEILDDLIDVGVDVFHPVQKGTMNAVQIARDYGDRLVFCVGFDVQHVLRGKSKEEIREEVRFLIDTFDRPEGGMCLAAGDSILDDTPAENVIAFLEEALSYGQAHRKQMNTARKV